MWPDLRQWVPPAHVLKETPETTVTCQSRIYQLFHQFFLWLLWQFKLKQREPLLPWPPALETTAGSLLITKLHRYASGLNQYQIWGLITFNSIHNLRTASESGRMCFSTMTALFQLQLGLWLLPCLCSQAEINCRSLFQIGVVPQAFPLTMSHYIHDFRGWWHNPWTQSKGWVIWNW